MSLLPQDSLRALGKLELLARTPKEGFITGRHRSPNKGNSVEFAEHRAYAPGDDLRFLDWRVLGKTNRLYIKEFVEETNLRATILLDASGSMDYTGAVASKINDKPISKFEYGRLLASLLTYLLINQQDAVGLSVFDSSLRSYIPAKAKPSQLKIILEELEKQTPASDTNLAEIFDDIAERVPRRGMIIIISDLLDDPEKIAKALHHFRYRHHEVLLFHILADEELTFPFDSFTEFASLEDPNEKINVDPGAIRARYLENVRNFLTFIKAECGKLSIDYIPMKTSKPYERALCEYLRSRRNPK